MLKFEVQVGDVWVIPDTPRYRGRVRRVLGVLRGFDGRPRVVYSACDDLPARDCYFESFVDWARKAELVHRV